MLPFCQSLKPGTPFKWDSELEELYEELKPVIIEEIEGGVRILEKSKPTFLATDWSKTGIEFWLFQNTGTAPLLNPSTAAQVGTLHLLGATSHMLLNHVTPQWKGRPLLLLIPLVKPDSSYWAAVT